MITCLSCYTLLSLCITPLRAQQPASADSNQQPPTTTGSNPDENKDLDKIPDTTQQPDSAGAAPPAASAANQRMYLENAFLPSVQQGGLLVPIPQSAAPSWQEQLFLDARKEWSLGDRLNLTVSDRFTLRAEDDIPSPNHENVLNEFREGYLSWEPFDRTYLDVGRINLKSGAALGFNPTDFFKTRAVVELLSADPSVLREDRLGTLMVRTQHIWQGGAVMAAFAPAVSRQSPIYTNTNLPNFNPSFDRTNAHDRLLLEGSVNIVGDVTPEFLFYREGNRSQFGTNITRSFGQSLVGYAEWAGGEQSSLIDQALRYGRETGTLPINAPSVLPDDPRGHFQNDLSLGASYTTQTKITWNLEYHFHQAGFSQQDLNDWFTAGKGATSASEVAGELWYIRDYALDQQQPLTRHLLFLRADWVDAFIPQLQITGFVNPDLYDGSSLVHLAADYYLSNAWTIGAQTSVNFGSRRSDFGGLPQAASILCKVARYF